MGMSGNYFRTDEETVADIRAGVRHLSDFIYDGALADQRLDIDKAWHAIHFTLTGAPYGDEGIGVLGRLVLGGNKLLEDDDDFSAMVISADDVQAMVPALAGVSEESFREDFDVPAMLENEIYPVTEDDDADDFFEYVWDYFEEIREIFQRAAEEGQAVIFYLS